MIDNVKERIKEYTKMIEKYPDIKEFYIERAKLYCEIQEYKKAVEDFKKSLSGYYACKNVIMVCEEIGLNWETEKLYTEAINRDKKDLNNYIRRLHFYTRNKEIEKALSDCKAILKLSPKNETILTLKKILTGK